MHKRNFSRSLAVLTLVAIAATAGAFADRNRKSGSGFKGKPVASSTAPDSEVQLFRIIASEGEVSADGTERGTSPTSSPSRQHSQAP